MASLVHDISDSDDTDLHDLLLTPKKKRPHQEKHSISMHDLFGGSEDEEFHIKGKDIRKRKRTSSYDSDRIVDPDEEPDVFTNKVLKKPKPELSDSDSDITVDYSPVKLSVRDQTSKSTPIKHNVCSEKKRQSLSNKSTLETSLSKDHVISDSDSDDERVRKLTQARLPHASLSKSKHNKISQTGKTQVTPSSHASMSKLHVHKSPSHKHEQQNFAHRKQAKKEVVKRVSYSDDSDVTVDLEEESKVPRKPDKRPMCRYGSKCYRKNPSHLQEFQHPKRNADSTGNHNSTLPSTSQSTGSSVKKSSESKRKSHTNSSVSPDVPTAGTSTQARRSLTSPADVVEDGGDLGFFLTKVAGVEKSYNDRLTMDIKDILSPSMGKLLRSAQFNYMTDIQWLVSQYPSQFRTLPLLIIHGSQRAEKAALDREAAAYSHVRLCQARLEIVYGTHHTKMMLLVYDNGMRVVIHTANLIHNDWHQKTQGIWISPLFPRLSSESSTVGDSSTHFKRDLLEYLSSYKARQLDEWSKTVREHDMSGAKVFIIASTPGRHTGEKKNAYGHLKLRKTLQNHGPTPLHVKNWPVVGQFSSIGSLGANKDLWVCGEWLSSLSAAKDSGFTFGDSTKLKLVFPSKDNVRLSLEGYPAGASLPYSINTAKKQTWLHAFFHQWRSKYRGRSSASPHIKTYLRVSPDWLNITWFLVTSANLSKAAWGALEKNAQQLMIRSYEIGVLFLPAQFGPSSSFRTMRDLAEPLHPDPSKQMLFPVPYDLPLMEYTKQDRPWVWDIQYRDKPDTNGNMWCPP